VELEFFPAVAVGASCSLAAPFLILPDEFVILPFGAEDWYVGEEKGVSPEVLPIVGVLAVRLVVVVGEGAPLSFEVVHVEGLRFLEQVQFANF